jgi:Skp family chaperone for outer membrane proteins
MSSVVSSSRHLVLAGILAMALALQPGISRAASYATVNIQKIMRESQAAQSARTQLEQKRSEYQSQITRIEEDLRKQDQALSEQRALLSADALKQKQQEFQGKLLNAQKEVRTKKIQLDKAYGQALQQIQDAVLQIVEESAKTKGLDMVIPVSQVLYAKPEMDITAEVMQKLNAKLPKLTLNFSAQ